MLRQDPTECLFAFICSSCNNIPRITLLVDRLCSMCAIANPRTELAVTAQSV